MKAVLFISLYRIATILIIIAPVFANILLQGSLVSSLVYAPLASLVLAIIAIYFDAHICNVLEKSDQSHRAEDHELSPFSCFRV